MRADPQEGQEGEESRKPEKAQQEGSRLAPVSLGVEFAAAIMGGCFVGVWIDRHYETAPWGTVGGATVGMAGGFYNFLRSAIKAFRASEREKLPDPIVESHKEKESQP